MSRSRAIVLLGLALGACATKPALNVPTIAVAPRPFAIEVSADGEMQAKQAVTLSSRSRAAVFVAWLAPEGGAVKAGDLVVELEANEVRVELEKAEAEVKKIEQELVKHDAQVGAGKDDLRADATRARISKDKASFKAGLSDGLLPGNEIAAAKMDLRLADIDLARIARSQTSQTPRDAAARSLLAIRLEKAKNTRDQAKSNAEQSRLVAPSAGVVRYQMTWKDTGRGKIAPGDRVWGGSPIVDLIDLDALEFVAKVREADAVLIAVDQKASLTLPAVPGRSFAAKITQVAAVAQQNEMDQNDKWIEVKLQIDGDTAPEIFPGLTGRVRISVLREDGVIAVPRDAVAREADSAFVYVATKGEPERRKITIGRESDDSVLVASGLLAGDVIFARDPTKTEAELAALRAKRQEEAKRHRRAGSDSGGFTMFF